MNVFMNFYHIAFPQVLNAVSLKNMMIVLPLSFLLWATSCSTETASDTSSRIDGSYTVLVDKKLAADLLKQNGLDSKMVDVALMLVDVKLLLDQGKGILNVDAGVFNEQIKPFNKPFAFEYEQKDSVLMGRLPDSHSSYMPVGVIRNKHDGGDEISVFFYPNRLLPDGATVVLEKE